MLGPRIEQRMQELGIRTQTDLAERAGLSVQHINALIRGSRGRRLGHTTVQKLSKALRVKPIFFEIDSAVAEKSGGANAAVGQGVGQGCPT
ncbi:hypothetical protein CBQ26_09275 [Deinococcus indicus]|uniref:HTH cro/C1-type domain-containing protein n=1 Tax=Deinococcus indicus TaxID=223556 RepID=A0A2D0A807_9DEIO|nr:hypothetical protein CBQ26_09275 [Deinococcus indicus]